MGKSKRGRASSSLYTPGPPRLNIDLQLWYHFVLYSHWLPQSFLACDCCALARDEVIDCVLGQFLLFAFSCDNRMTVQCCAMRLFNCVLGQFLSFTLFM